MLHYRMKNKITNHNLLWTFNIVLLIILFIGLMGYWCIFHPDTNIADSNFAQSMLILAVVPTLSFIYTYIVDYKDHE